MFSPPLNSQCEADASFNLLPIGRLKPKNKRNRNRRKVNGRKEKGKKYKKPDFSAFESSALIKRKFNSKRS